MVVAGRLMSSAHVALPLQLELGLGRGGVQQRMCALGSNCGSGVIWMSLILVFQGLGGLGYGRAVCSWCRVLSLPHPVIRRASSRPVTYLLCKCLLLESWLK